MKKYVFIIILFQLLASNLKSQPCYNFHKDYACSIKDILDFKIFGQSKSAMVEAKKTYQYQVVLFGGYDYKIGLCTELTYGPLHFRIINASEAGTVFYDNKDDDYVETVGFSIERTKKVIFEITLLAADKEFKDMSDVRACIGVAIYWAKTPKIGI